MKFEYEVKRKEKLTNFEQEIRKEIENHEI